MVRLRMLLVFCWSTCFLEGSNWRDVLTLEVIWPDVCLHVFFSPHPFIWDSRGTQVHLYHSQEVSQDLIRGWDDHHSYF